MNTQHLHNYVEIGNYYVCTCGKKILNFKMAEDGKLKATRKDGKIYTKKANKDRFLFPDEYLKIFEKLLPRQKHAATFLLNTGVRIAEGQKMPSDDLFYDPKGRSRLTIRFVKTKARKGEFKTGKQRVIPISKQFAKYLVRFLKLNESPNFKLLSTPGFNIAIKKAAVKANIKDPHDISAHTFRKTIEVWLMALGVNDLRIVAHLGHDIATAASHYISPDIFSIEDKMKIRHIIGDLYNG